MKNSNGKTAINVSATFEGLTIKRHGEGELRFLVDEQHIAAATRILLIRERKAAALIVHNGKRYTIGMVDFGGLNIKPSGDCTIKLWNTVTSMRLPLSDLEALAQEDILLRVVT